MTFARDAALAARQATSDPDRPPARSGLPVALVEHVGTAVGNRSLARLIATEKLARQPQKRSDPAAADLEDWAKWPDEAHKHWKRLGTLERIAVLERMRRRYGKDFAEQFRAVAEAGKADLDARDCEMPVCTPEQYLEQGYKVADRADYQIWLVHPTGRRRYLFGGHAANQPLIVDPPREVPPPPPVIRQPPPVVIDPAPPDFLRTNKPPIDYSRPRR